MSKYGGAVARAVGVVPEADRHRRHRLADHELAELADDRLARPGRTPRRRRRGSGPTSRPRTPAAAGTPWTMPGADVGAAAAEVEEHAPGRTARRATRTPRAASGEPAAPIVRIEERSKSRPGSSALLAAGHHERRAEAEHRRPRLLREPPLVREVGVGGVAVDHHDRRAQEQRRDERVPHHPGGRREPLQPVARAEVPAERRGSSGARAGCRRGRGRSPSAGRSCPTRRGRRAGGRTAAASNSSGPLVASSSSHAHRVRERVVGAARVGDVDDGLAAIGSAVADRRHLLAAVDELVAVAVAGDGEQHLRLELAEPVEHAADAELRRAGRPDRAEARGREEGDERLRDVRQVRDDAVAGRRRRAAAGRRARARPAPAARRTSARRARATASARRPRPRRRPRRGRACARRSSAARRGTTPRPASRASRARARTARARGSRSTPRATTRSPRGRRPTSARGRRSPRSRGRARVAATAR